MNWAEPGTVTRRREIATFNVNGVNGRPLLLRWLREQCVGALSEIDYDHNQPIALWAEPPTSHLSARAEIAFRDFESLALSRQIGMRSYSPEAA